MASIGWIDFSTEDRNRVGSVLDMLRPEGMVDELGLGTIRDALANQLFPGISTIQTRAKYFFIIPYILLDYQTLTPAKRRAKPVLKFLEDNEFEIMWHLASKYNHEEGYGVIGITKRKPDKIVRRPSAIYWNGLNTYKFIGSNGLSAETFLQQATNQSFESLISARTGEDVTGDDLDVDYENIFHVGIPPKTNWRNELTLDLHKEEAEVFHDKITTIAKNKLIAELLVNDELWNVFVKADSFIQFTKATVTLSLSTVFREMIVLAHDFSELMYGAHLAYNCQLQAQFFNNGCYEVEWKNWLTGIPDNMLDYAGFNLDRLFSYTPTTRTGTKQFVKEWWEQTKKGFPDIGRRNKLVENQEAIVKGGKARLRWNKSDDVKIGHWHGLRYFEYRFRQTRTILNDVKTGLIE